MFRIKSIQTYKPKGYCGKNAHAQMLVKKKKSICMAKGNPKITARHFQQVLKNANVCISD